MIMAQEKSELLHSEAMELGRITIILLPYNNIKTRFPMQWKRGDHSTIYFDMCQFEGHWEVATAFKSQMAVI